MPLRAVTLDYWDTLYVGAALPERVTLRRAALRRLVAALGARVPDAELDALYDASGEEAERWWHQQRGYVTAERVRWVLDRLDLPVADDDPHLLAMLDAVDDALAAHPPALVPGAADAVRALAGAGLRLAIVSDTGFASGHAQTRILERDGLAAHLGALVYSCDVGHAKPHREPFAAALRALGVAPEEALHVGDIERTDVAGALAAGLRAVRCDVVRTSGASAAELAGRTWEAIVAHVLATRDRGAR